jgi:hypothetical protein
MVAQRALGADVRGQFGGFGVGKLGESFRGELLCLRMDNAHCY